MAKKVEHIFINGVEYKKCVRCGDLLPPTTLYFRKYKRSWDGLQGNCKKCANKYNEENKEKIVKQQHEKYLVKRTYYLEKAKEHYQDNKEKILEYHKKYSIENKDRILEYRKQWYLSLDKEQQRIKWHKYYEANKEKKQEYAKEWRKNNLGKLRLKRINNLGRYKGYKHKRDAIKKQLPHTLTTKQWESCKNYFKNDKGQLCCAYCGEILKDEIHQEHFVALSNGGEYTLNNIVPSCKRCNCSKRSSDFFTWYPRQKYYSKEREIKILKYLHYNKNNKIQQLALI